MLPLHRRGWGFVRSGAGQPGRARPKTKTCMCGLWFSGDQHMKGSAAGQRYGRLTLIEDSGQRSSSREHLWLARCDCGREKIVRPSALRYGRTASCGCLQAEANIAKARRSAEVRSAKMQLVHKHRSTYSSWQSMRDRCENPSSNDFPRYGGRGIKISQAWNCFEQFLRDMGERPKGKTLDRIDVNGDYTPSNCRWATPKQQARNRANNRMVLHEGTTLPLSEWADRMGVPSALVLARLNRGWTASDALNRPVQIKFRSTKL